ncbi:RING finger protein 11 [Hydra vulgaris]|uniref:RING finger protein 11 n=1 Tax=Hydra vulgaris TaxID=6087 RepID=T2M2C7_HYDVU|nr:RING finger protein 11 [Hydra vulgaris]XP_047146472.1 RING finger protein 11 [Hydra vulgaris]
MGNCLKSRTVDRISLLRENDVSSTELHQELPPPYVQNYEEEPSTIFNLTPSNQSSSISFTEEQSLRIAHRLSLIQHLPSGSFDGTKKRKECVICMCDFDIGDPMRFLPCLHTYHKQCIDNWLLRSFTCPSCMEPVDAALLSTFFTSE